MYYSTTPNFSLLSPEINIWTQSLHGFEKLNFISLITWSLFFSLKKCWLFFWTTDLQHLLFSEGLYWWIFKLQHGINEYIKSHCVEMLSIMHSDLLVRRSWWFLLQQKNLSKTRFSQQRAAQDSECADKASHQSAPHTEKRRLQGQTLRIDIISVKQPACHLVEQIFNIKRISL